MNENSSSGIFVARLAESLKNKANIVVVTPSGPNENDENSEPNLTISSFAYAPKNWQILAHGPGGIPVALRNHSWLYLLLPSFLFCMLVQCIRESRSCQVIHANWAICGCIAGLAGKITRTPVVTTLRGEDVTRAKSSMLNRMILIMAIRLSNCTACVSASMLQWIDTQIELGKKATVVPNGVNDKFLKIGKNRKCNSEKKEIRIVSIGSLIPRKGFDVIINALSTLPDKEKLRLIIVGSGPERNNLQELAETTQFADRITFTGYTPPQKIPDYLESADIFILASHSEGRPNVILEAMAAGLPIIASDIAGNNELIEPNETGLLFEDRNSEQLQNCVIALMGNPEQRWEFGQKAMNKLHERGLYWDNTADNYQRLYEKAAEAR